MRLIDEFIFREMKKSIFFFIKSLIRVSFASKNLRYFISLEAFSREEHLFLK